MKFVHFAFLLAFLLDFDQAETYTNVSAAPISLNELSDFLEHVDDDSIVILNCQGTLLNNSDTVFAKANDKAIQTHWEKLQARRKLLNEHYNQKIDEQIMAAQTTQVSEKLCDKLRSLKEKGHNVILFIPVDDHILFPSHVTEELKHQLVALTGQSTYWSGIFEEKNKKNGVIEPVDGIIAASLVELPVQINYLVAHASKDKKGKLKKIVFVSTNNDFPISIQNVSGLDFQFKPVQLEMKENLINDELIDKQFDILISETTWIDDRTLLEFSNKSPEDVICKICTQKILHSCPCRETHEEDIHRKAKLILGESRMPDYAEDIIDDIEMLRTKIFDIVFFAVKMVLINNVANLEQKKVFAAIEKIPNLKFIGEKNFTNYIPFKALRTIGSGIHWKDMLAYDYIRHMINPRHNIRKPEQYMKARYDRYLKALETVIKDGKWKERIEQTKQEFIQGLIKEGISAKQIASAYDIPEDEINGHVKTLNVK